MRKRPFIIQSVCFAAALVAACGGDDSSVTANDAGGGGPDGTVGGDGGQNGTDGAQSGGDGGTGTDTGGGTDGTVPFDAGASVVQHHKNPNRDGVYVDGALTKAAVAGLKPDTTFKPQFPSSQIYAQPLFVEAGIGGKDVLIIATEQNVVYAVDATTGAQIWKTPPLATPVSKNDLPCGNIDTLGITGTPYLDLPSRTIYLGAMTTPDNGSTKKHKIFALSLDDGSVKTGWPVDVEASVSGFVSDVQNQRGALVLLDGILYVPYGGHYGDCGDYHGWVVGVDVSKPTTVKGWSTPAKGGGAWCAGGVSTDGTSIYVTTGNTFGANAWGGGDAVIRLGKGPVFSNAATDYFAPSNWPDLDSNDTDMGTHALVNAPAATPSSLVLGFGKDGKIYVTDHANMGGVGTALATYQATTATPPCDPANDPNCHPGEITAAVTTYTTSAGTFVAFRIDGGQGYHCPDNNTGNMAAVKIAGSPPTVTEVWCAKEGDMSIPITSMTDAAGSNAIVWNMGSHLYAYDAETGAELFDGGSTTTDGTRYFNTPLIAKGRVFVPADGTIYAFKP